MTYVQASAGATGGSSGVQKKTVKTKKSAANFSKLVAKKSDNVKPSGGEKSSAEKTNIANPKMSLEQTVSSQLEQFSANWQQLNSAMRARIRDLSPAARPLVELQVMVNDLGIKSQLISRVGETLAGTVRKVQQLGSN